MHHKTFQYAYIYSLKLCYRLKCKSHTRGHKSAQIWPYTSQKSMELQKVGMKKPRNMGVRVIGGYDCSPPLVRAPEVRGPPVVRGFLLRDIVCQGFLRLKFSSHLIVMFLI